MTIILIILERDHAVVFSPSFSVDLYHSAKCPPSSPMLVQMTRFSSF
jgi:hypothetical protein